MIHHLFKPSTYLALACAFLVVSSNHSSQLYAQGDSANFAPADELMIKKTIELFAPHAKSNALKNIDATNLQCVFSADDPTKDFFDLNNNSFSYLACISSPPESSPQLVFGLSNVFSLLTPKDIEDVQQSPGFQAMKLNVKNAVGADELPCVEITDIGILFYFTHCAQEPSTDADSTNE